MKFSQIPTDTFQTLAVGAGMLLSTFDPSTATVTKANILGPTSGGISFDDDIEFKDWGDDVDNCPKNTMEMKRIDDRTVKISGSFIAIKAALAKMMAAAADVASNKITPRKELKNTDFADIWFVGDYSDINSDSGQYITAGFIAIHMMNALSTGGFKLQTEDKEKGKFSFEFTGHYSISDPDTIPYEIYISPGTDTTPTTP